MCCQGCSSFSCLLYAMGWFNLLLATGAYTFGFILLFGYPVYFAIESPIDIIIAPIGLVFVLEIDNWTFNIAKTFYAETEEKELWEFKQEMFGKPTLSKRIKKMWENVMGFVLINLNVAFIVTVIYSIINLSDGTGVIVSAFWLGFLFLSAFVLYTFIGIVHPGFGWRCIGRSCKCKKEKRKSLKYDDEDLFAFDNKTMVVEATKNNRAALHDGTDKMQPEESSNDTVDEEEP